MSAWLIVLIVLVAAFIIFAIERVVRAHLRRVSAGREDLVGRTGIARTPLNPEGMVLVYGERWTAVSDGGPIVEGEEVVVRAVEGLTLHVSKK